MCQHDCHDPWCLRYVIRPEAAVAKTSWPRYGLLSFWILVIGAFLRDRDPDAYSNPF